MAGSFPRNQFSILLAASFCAAYIILNRWLARENLVETSVVATAVPAALGPAVILREGQHFARNVCVVFGKGRRRHHTSKGKHFVGLVDRRTFAPKSIRHERFWTEYSGEKFVKFPKHPTETNPATAESCVDFGRVLVLPTMMHHSSMYHVFFQSAATIDLVLRLYEVHDPSSVFVAPMIVNEKDGLPVSFATEPIFNFFVVDEFLHGKNETVATWSNRIRDLTTRCSCFDEIYYGAIEFVPDRLGPDLMHMWQSYTALVTATHESRGTTEESSSSGSRNRILFILRKGDTRTIWNEPELRNHSAFGARGIGGFRVDFAHMEDKSTSEQLALIRQTRILVGVHGQGLSWTTFLPTATGACACIEITGSWKPPGDYRRWSKANGVSYSRLRQKDAPTCRNEKRFRICGNVTVDPSAVASHIKAVIEGMQE